MSEIDHLLRWHNYRLRPSPVKHLVTIDFLQCVHEYVTLSKSLPDSTSKEAQLVVTSSDLSDLPPLEAYDGPYPIRAC